MSQDWPARVEAALGADAVKLVTTHGQVQVEIDPKNWLAVARRLHDDEGLALHLFVDLSGVDYLHYGLSEWQTNTATHQGYDRSVDEQCARRYTACAHPRFAVVVQLLSVKHQQRLQLKTFCPILSGCAWIR